MRRAIPWLAVVVVLSLIGCGRGLVSTRMLRTSVVGRSSEITLLDSNDPRIQLVRDDDPNRSPHPLSVLLTSRDVYGHVYKTGVSIGQHGPRRLRYTSLSPLLKEFVCVKGEFASGVTLPVTLDTGMKAPVFLTARHAAKARLPVFPLPGQHPQFGGAFGVCYVPELRLGSVVLREILGEYTETSIQVCLLGIPIASQDSVLIGLPILRYFKYMRFDNAAEELELSLYEPFACEDPHQWDKCPFADSAGEDRLLVEIPIAGHQATLLLDTGTAGDLVMKRRLADVTVGQDPEQKWIPRKTWFPYYVGLVDCEWGVVDRLVVGSRHVEHVTVEVLPDEIDLPQCDGLIGAGFFRNAQEYVIDFHGSCLWIKW